MKICYRKAAATDLSDVMRLIRAAVAEMTRAGIDQWDEIYPSEADLAADIAAEQMYCGSDGSRIAVIYVLNQACDPAYQNADWMYTGGQFFVLHRFCVDPAYQHRGLAQQTLQHLEDALKRQGCMAIRLDVFTENPAALRLYERNGYRQTGTADWRKGRFLLMEKLL